MLLVVGVGLVSAGCLTLVGSGCVSLEIRLVGACGVALVSACCLPLVGSGCVSLEIRLDRAPRPALVAARAAPLFPHFRPLPNPVRRRPPRPASAVALIVVVRAIPAALVAPLAATLADRFPRRLVMIWADAIRAVLMGCAAVAIASGSPAWLVYVIATLSTVSGAPFRPAQSALLPGLARTPAELTAANVASSTLESVGIFAGPALGGILYAATNAQ